MAFGPVFARAASPDLVNGIAVIVGERVITYKDLQLALEEDIEILERRFAGQPQTLAQKVTELQTERLQELIENQLVLQEFKRAGYIEPESFIKARIDEDIRKYGDRLTLTKTLQAQGMTFEAYKTRIREREILRLMWQTKVPRDPLISPTKIENYYAQNLEKFKMEDQVKLRMIVLTNQPSGAPFSAKALANEITAKLKEKVPFEELARIYSNGSQAQQGGEWGWVQKSVLRTDLASRAFNLDPGNYSEPLETPSGIYIMLVEDKKVSYTKTLPEVRDVIEDTLKSEESARVRKQWVEQLKAKSFVRYF